MILMTEIQLGMAEQHIYKVDELNNFSIVATVPLDQLGGTLCALYRNENATEAVIHGPHDYAVQVEDAAKEAAVLLYGNSDMNIHIYKEN